MWLISDKMPCCVGGSEASEPTEADRLFTQAIVPSVDSCQQEVRLFGKTERSVSIASIARTRKTSFYC